MPGSTFFHSPAWLSMSVTECELSLLVLDELLLGEDSIALWIANTE